MVLIGFLNLNLILKKYKRNIKFILANVLRDVKGANVLCLRYSNNTKSDIARNFNVITNVCNNPHHKCIFHK